MLAVLGVFVFQLKTTPYETLTRSTKWNWATNQRVGARPSYQYTGQGEDSITLAGTLYPELTGGRLGLDALRTMADSGLAWPLIDGEGYVYGLWFIESIDEDRANMFSDGAPRKIGFSINLKRYDDSQIDKLGMLSRVGLSLLR